MPLGSTLTIYDVFWLFANCKVVSFLKYLDKLIKRSSYDTDI